MAHISVVCPRCGSRYQLDPTLRGKQMRCPNTVCRAIFEVREEVTPPSAPPAAPKTDAPAAPRVSHTVGAVGEIVPILQAEVATPPAEGVPKPAAREALPAVQEPRAAPEPTPTWQQVVPPVRGRGAAAPAEAPAVARDESLPLEVSLGELESSAPASDAAELPEDLREVAAGAWDAPPVRSGSGIAEPDGFAQPPLASSTLLQEKPAREVVRARRRSRWLIVALLLFLSGGLGLAAWVFLGRRAGDEAERLQRAEKLYGDLEFAAAARLLQNLQRDFPDSANIKRYRFLAELADVREPVHQSQGDPEEAYKSLGRVVQFLQVYHKDALLKPHEADVWSTLYRIARELTEGAERNKERRLVDRARLALTELAKRQPPPGTNAPETIHQLQRVLTQVETVVWARESRQAKLGELKTLLPKASAETVQQARALVVRAELMNDPEAHDLLQQLTKGHVARVTYNTPLLKDITPPNDEEAAPSVLLSFERDKGAAAGVKGTVFALARGVLYALDAQGGAPRWGLRVGADVRVLPLRLPASALAPDTIVVVASDQKTVSAHAVDSGAVLWRHGLGAACVAQPLRVGPHLLVPTLAGRVEEINLSGGQLLGYYELGQPLTVGGVHQEGTPFVYFPADDFCIYVLDVAKKSCAGVLYTGHAGASLRTPPVIAYGAAPVKGSKASGEGDRLLLFQTSGPREAAVKAFTLPIVDADQKPLQPDLTLRGRVDFAPWHDAERLALATDTGALELYGHKPQSRNAFPLVRLSGSELGLDSSGAEVGPALIAHADAENFWVVGGGRLHRLQTLFTREAGPKLTPRWPVPPIVGSPLHAAQVLEDAAGRPILFVSGQERADPTCLARAIDGLSGKRLWQRQLGALCEDAVAVGERVLARDRHGLLLFDAKTLPANAHSPWLRGNASRTPLPAAESSRFFAHDGDGYLVTWSHDRSSPVLHFYQVAKNHEGVKATGPPSLRARVAGPPALMKDALIAALENGVFVHVPLTDPRVTSGPNWPAAAIEDPGPRYVVFLGGADVLVTDGHRAMKVYRWPSATQVFPLGEEYKLPQRIAAIPVVLAEERSEPPYRIAVADVGGTLHLLQGPPFTPLRSWPLGGKITSGPVVLGKHLACVVDHRRIVWLDPGSDEPLWAYSLDADVVGQPCLVDQTVVVATVAGQFLGLDAATGSPRGPGYTLRANVAPSVAPVPLGAGRLFAPLSDGTVLLLSLKQLQ